MLKSNGHPIDLGCCGTRNPGDIAPFPYCPCGSEYDRRRFFLLKAKIFGHRYSEPDITRAVVNIDIGLQYSWLHIGRHRVEIINRKELPAGLVFPQEAVIT